MQVLDQRIVKIRKIHHCWGCTKEFPPGSELEICTTVDGGEIMSAYWCKTCQDFMSTLDYWDTMDGFEYGGLLNYENYPK